MGGGRRKSMSAFLEAWRRAASGTKGLRPNICPPLRLITSPSSSSDAQHVIPLRGISTAFDVSPQQADDCQPTGTAFGRIDLVVPVKTFAISNINVLCFTQRQKSSQSKSTQTSPGLNFLFASQKLPSTFLVPLYCQTHTFPYLLLLLPYNHFLQFSVFAPARMYPTFSGKQKSCVIAKQVVTSLNCKTVQGT